MANDTGAIPRMQDGLAEMDAERKRQRILNPEKGWRPVKLDALRARPDIERKWLMDGVIEENGFVALGALHKTGKTRLSRCLAATIAGDRRDTFLGRDVKHGRVLCLSMEDPHETTVEHFDELEADGTNIVLLDNPDDRQAERCQWLENLLMAMNPKPVLVVMDTIIGFLERRAVLDTNAYAQAYDELDSIKKVARRTKTAILGLHHAKKNFDSSKWDLTELMGSAAFGAVPDFVLVMSTDDDRRIIYGKGRAPDFEKTYLTEDTGGYTDIDEPVWKGERRGMWIEIMDYVRANDGPSKSKIRAGVQGDNGAIGKQIAVMVDAGDLIPHPGGQGGGMRLYPAT